MTGAFITYVVALLLGAIPAFSQGYSLFKDRKSVASLRRSIHTQNQKRTAREWQEPPVIEDYSTESVISMSIFAVLGAVMLAFIFLKMDGIMSLILYCAALIAAAYAGTLAAWYSHVQSFELAQAEFAIKPEQVQEYDPKADQKARLAEILKKNSEPRG